MREAVKLKELLARVESATGADRELDYAIFDDILGGVYDYETVGEFFHRPRTEAFPVEFTKSLDACVALIEKALPGWEVVLEIHAAASDAGVYSPAWPKGPNASGDGNTPPLALLAATLRALLQIEERKAGGERDAS
jgi:hypothetical protein